jgi:hypothetical protein
MVDRNQDKVHMWQEKLQSADFEEGWLFVNQIEDQAREEAWLRIGWAESHKLIGEVQIDFLNEPFQTHLAVVKNWQLKFATVLQFDNNCNRGFENWSLKCCATSGCRVTERTFSFIICVSLSRALKSCVASPCSRVESRCSAIWLWNAGFWFGKDTLEMWLQECRRTCHLTHEVMQSMLLPLHVVWEWRLRVLLWLVWQYQEDWDKLKHHPWIVLAESADPIQRLVNSWNYRIFLSRNVMIEFNERSSLQKPLWKFLN